MFYLKSKLTINNNNGYIESNIPAFSVISAKVITFDAQHQLA
jgi:hypothetical protein